MPSVTLILECPNRSIIALGWAFSAIMRAAPFGQYVCSQSHLIIGFGLRF